MSHAAPLDEAIGCPLGLAPANSPSKFEGLNAFAEKIASGQRIELSVRGARCGGCLSKIEKSVQGLPGVECARLNLSNGRMVVDWGGTLKADKIAETISELGYGVSAIVNTDGEDVHKKEERALLISMGIAGFAAANIMLLSVSVWGGHGEMGEGTRNAFHALSGLIAFPVVLFSGRHFFKSAFAALKNGHANMDVPISLAISLAFIASVWETAAGAEHAYFDACAMLIFFLLAGRFLDARLRHRAWSAAHELAAMRNTSVTRVNDTGQAETIRASDVETGDRIIIAPGERVSVDLVIETGTSDVDESIITGESLPRKISQGMTLYGGSVNGGAALTGRVIGKASNSLLSDISDMLEAGEQARSSHRKIADRAVSFYVPFVHTTAALAFLAWMILGATWRDSVMIAVTTLIITCPCALALAAPVVQVVASSRLFKLGTYLKSGDALERLASVDHIVFDKTGTLTLGEPRYLPSPETDAVLSKAAMLARASRHPLSRALVAAAGAGPVATQVKEYAGLGLEAEIAGEMCRLGSADWVGVSHNAETDGPSLWFGAGEGRAYLFRFADDLPEESKATIIALKKAGFSMEIVSGDRAPAVEDTANALGISTWAASAKPQDKVARLEALKAAGHNTLMVGDGLNDAGALALASASLAPGGALDVSQAASDAVYSGGIKALPGIIKTSKHARHIMLQNFALAALYNVIAVPIAVTGHVTPLIAAIAMSLSSLIVTLNALRLGAK